MKHIVEDFNENIYNSALWDFYFKGLKVGVLDIESTGLNPRRNKFVLGCLFNCQEGKLHQILAANRQEEQMALEAYLEEIKKVDMLVTYNGKHFDIPFVEGRLKKPVTMPYNLDLYLLVNGYSPIKKLVPNLKQKTLENYMGLWSSRADEISGAESVNLFNHYEATGDSEAEKKILLHNNDDVKQLTRLTKVIQKSDFHKAMYKMGFPLGPFTVSTIRIKKSVLEICGNQRTLDYQGFFMGAMAVHSRFEKEKGTFKVEIPIIRIKGMALVDLQGAEVDCGQFEVYPDWEKGLLIIEKQSQPMYREINHFIKVFFEKFVGI